MADRPPPTSYLDPRTREHLYDLSGGVCLACERSMTFEQMQVDHIICQSRCRLGHHRRDTSCGLHHISNLQPLCAACNMRKNDGSMERLLALNAEHGPAELRPSGWDGLIECRGCGERRPHAATGLCPACYLPPEHECIVEGCETVGTTRKGMCPGHYNLLKQPHHECAVEGCETVGKTSKVMCPGHYKLLKAPHHECVVEGYETVGKTRKGMCPGHYKLLKAPRHECIVEGCHRVEVTRKGMCSRCSMAEWRRSGRKGVCSICGRSDQVIVKGMCRGRCYPQAQRPRRRRRRRPGAGQGRLL